MKVTMTEKKRQGFGAMSPEQQQAIASAGGKTAHQRGTAYKFTSEKAREAAAKSATVRAAKRAAIQPQSPFPTPKE